MRSCVAPFWVTMGCCDTGWLGSGGARGDLDGKPARCQPGHHRDAVRIAVDGRPGPEDDRRALGQDVGQDQLNGRRMSLYDEGPGNRPGFPVLPDAAGTERDRRMMADVEEQAGAHLGIAHEVSGRETCRGDL